MILILILTLLYTSAFGNTITKEINEERKKFDYKPISYNNDLEYELNVYKKAFGNDWTFDNAQYLMNYSTFDKYPFEFFYSSEYKLSMKNNVKFRAGLKKCWKGESYEDLELKNNKDDCRSAGTYPLFIDPDIKQIACVDLDEKYACFKSYRG